MIYGRYTGFVQEVVDFTMQGEILKQKFRHSPSLGARVHIITSLIDVDRYRDGRHPRAQIGKPYTWHDMIMGDVESAINSSDPPLDDDWYRSTMGSIQAASLEMHDKLDKQFLGDPDVPEREIEFIVSNLSAIITVRSIQGAGDSLSELMYHVYKAYGHPCGWLGDSETGSLVVYTK